MTNENNNKKAKELLDTLHDGLSFYSGGGLGGASISINNVRRSIGLLKKEIKLGDKNSQLEKLDDLEGSIMGLTLIQSSNLTGTVDSGNILFFSTDEAIGIIDSIRDNLGLHKDK